VELKSIDVLAPVHQAQLLTYLKTSNKKVGLLINFNVQFLKNGLKRVVNRYARPALTQNSSAVSAPEALQPGPPANRPGAPSTSLSPRLRASASEPISQTTEALALKEVP